MYFPGPIDGIPNEPEAEVTALANTVDEVPQTLRDCVCAPLQVYTFGIVPNDTVAP